MESQGHLVLDISSDEETGFVGAAGGGGGVEFGDKEDGDWLSKLLVEVGGDRDVDDAADDVVFLSEVLPQKKQRSETVKMKVADDDDDDDDCVVLDGDPDGSGVVVSNKVDDDSDDLEIVGEKGEVACRDFPHARHLCAKYLFASSPHEVHCSQCHCYVCDSLAPCPHWGTGVNSIDHCHASDKDEYWRAERKHVKNSDKPVKKIGKPVTDVRTRIDSFFKSVQENPIPLPQNQGFNPVTIRPCNLSSSLNSPNPMVSRVRSQPQPGNVALRCNPRSMLGSVQSHPRNNNPAAPRVALGNKSHWRSNNPQPFPQRAGIKRNAVLGASVVRSLRRPPFQAPATNGHYGSNQHLYGTQPAVSVMPLPELSSPHNMNARHANFLLSQPLINSQPYSSCLNPDLIPLQSQMPSQLPLNPIPLPLPPYVYSQPSVGKINSSPAPEPFTEYVPNNHVPQNVTSWQPDAVNTFSDRWHSGSTISSPVSGVGTAFGNDSSQLQEHSNPTASSSTGGQNDVHHQYHTQSGTGYTQSGMGSSPIDFDLFCDSSVNNSNVQIHAEQSQYPSAETSQVQHMQHEGPSIASVVVDNSPQQSAELSKANAAYASPLICAETSQIQNTHHDQPRLASVVVDNRPQQSVEVAAAASTTNGADCQLPESKEPGSFDFGFLDSWMFENQSFSGAAEANALPDWNVYSPEAAFADTGTLFDL